MKIVELQILSLRQDLLTKSSKSAVSSKCEKSEPVDKSVGSPSKAAIVQSGGIASTMEALLKKKNTISEEQIQNQVKEQRMKEMEVLMNRFKRKESKNAKLTMQERLSIALGTANAITYLHTAFSSSLIHRDVNTANISLDDTNKSKLGDFGITTLLDNQSMNTTTVIGTSAYMGPEPMRGDISIKCDTFSFGVVLLELLTSLTPYDENRDGHDLITHVEDNCEGSILPLLDTSIGSWEINKVNFADELFSIACQCIEEKKKRPIMVDVCEMLMIIISKM